MTVSDLCSAVSGGTKPSCWEFWPLHRYVIMPALFAYLLAISVALGGGYAGLRWLAAPESSTGQHSSASAKLPNKGKKLPEKPDPDVARMAGVESVPRDRAETTASTAAPSGASNEAAPETSRNEPGVSEVSPRAQTQNVDAGQTGGCSPIGLTASGQLVFPMHCQAFLERNRGPENSQVPVSTNPPNPPELAALPKERQAAEPAPAADQITGLNREGSANEANAKVDDISPSGEAKPGKENLEPDVAKGKKVGKRNMQSSSSKPVMMILRTVEFPDGRREERLLPMNRSRRTSLRTEDQWFSPLGFR